MSQFEELWFYFQLRRKEEIRLKAEKIRRRAEKYAQSKAMKKLMKEVCGGVTGRKHTHM